MDELSTVLQQVLKKLDAIESKQSNGVETLAAVLAAPKKRKAIRDEQGRLDSVEESLS